MDILTSDTVLAAIIAFIAAIVAAGITLLGVWLQNRHARKCLLEQLSIEANERKHERELVLRKEVYLKAVEDMTRAIRLFGEFAGDNPEKINMAAFAEGFSSSVGKINVVGTDETVYAVAEFNKRYNVMLFGLAEFLMPLIKLKIDMDILSKQLDEHVSRRKEVLHLMQHFNMQLESNQQKWDVLQKDFDYANEQVEKIVNEHDVKNTEYFKRKQKLILVIAKEQTELIGLQGPVVVAIRRELGLSFDDVRFLEQLEQGSKDVVLAVEGFVKKLDSFVEDS